MGARKTSSAKNSSIVAIFNKRREWPWSELPPTKPFVHIPRYLVRTGNNAPPITKSQLPATTRCNNAHQQPQLVHIITKSATHQTSPINSRSQFLDDSATIDAKTVFHLETTSYWCVLRVDSMPLIAHGPPPPPEIPYYRFDLRGPPMMTMTGLLGPNIPNSGLVVYYAVSAKTGHCMYRTKHVSIRHECATIDPFDPNRKLIEFTTSVIRSRGKVYAISLQGTLVVMEASNHRLKITSMGAIRAIPSSNWRFFKEYLVEMNGEILLVFLIYEKSLATVDRVEVFRLDLVKLGWIKVERLGGKTMFLKEKCIWVNSAELGCRHDCVYFVQGSNDFWRVFDLKSGGISTVLTQN